MSTICRSAIIAAVLVYSFTGSAAREAPRCDGHLKPGGKWQEIATTYARPRREMPNFEKNPMLSARAELNCDQSFQRMGDSVRFRISFCHDRLAGAADSGKMFKIGAHLLNIREVPAGGRTVLDLSIRTQGCDHPWGLLIRKDELPAFKTLLKELSFSPTQE